MFAHDRPATTTRRPLALRQTDRDHDGSSTVIKAADWPCSIRQTDRDHVGSSTVIKAAGWPRRACGRPCPLPRPSIDHVMIAAGLPERWALAEENV